MNPTAQPDAALAAPGRVAPAVRFEGVSIGPRRLSFALAPGSFHVLTGAARSGKTSVLDLICAAGRPAAGRVEVFGRDTASLDRKELARFRRRIGRVYADDRLLGHLPALENAALVPRLARRRRRDYLPEVMRILTWVGLGRKMDALPAALSAAERRRLAIAGAVAGQPDIVLADEPTGGLEGDGALRVLRLLAEINGAGTAVLMTTGDEALAAASGAPVIRLGPDRTAVLDGLDPAVAP